MEPKLNRSFPLSLYPEEKVSHVRPLHGGSLRLSDRIRVFEKKGKGNVWYALRLCQRVSIFIFLLFFFCLRILLLLLKKEKKSQALPFSALHNWCKMSQPFCKPILRWQERTEPKWPWPLPGPPVRGVFSQVLLRPAVATVEVY